MRGTWVALMILSLLASGAAHAQTSQTAKTLVLPLRTVGVNDTTLAVSRNLLESSLEDLGVSVQHLPRDTDLPVGEDACDTPDCAQELAQHFQVDQVVYGSLSKLGDKIIARISVIRSGEQAPYYREQLASTTESDLDTVMLRFAEGISAGRANSNLATIDSVTQAETETPARRASRRGFGFRAGFLYPTGDSFAGTERLANLRLAFKVETHNYLIESTALTGLAWGSGQVDWTLFDLSASRIFGTGDLAMFVGAGVGLHVVHVEVNSDVLDPSSGYEYTDTTDQSATAPTFDIVVGVLALRTYDFQVILASARCAITTWPRTSRRSAATAHTDSSSASAPAGEARSRFGSMGAEATAGRWAICSSRTRRTTTLPPLGEPHLVVSCRKRDGNF